MGHYLPYLIAGLVTGSVYGLAGTGLVLTYKTSGVFNLAHGAVATVAAYLFYELDVRHGWPWGLAALVCIAVLGPVFGLAFEVLARVLSGASLVTKVASTVGLLLVIVAIVQLRYDPATTLSVPQYLPGGAFHLGSTRVTAASVIIFLVAAAAALLLYAFFRVARLGAAMRAVVDDPSLLDLAGTSPIRVRRCSWMIGVSFAAASGVLLAPLLTQLNALNLTFLVVTAFGAAAVGSFSSLPLTYVGGLAIGILQELCTKWFTTGSLTGLSPALPFLVLFVVLLVAPKRRLADHSRVVPRSRPVSAPWPVQAVGAVVVLAFLAYVPHSHFAGVHLTDWTNGLAYVLLFISLGLLVRTSGQVSLAHVSFMAIGVCAMAHLAGGHHVPWALALLLSGLVAVPIGALLAVPAIRLSGLYLALATLGFGILLQYMFYTESYMFGAGGLGLSLPRPKLSWLRVDSDRGYYYLVLVLVALAALGVVALNRGRLGRLLAALADSPTGLSTSGTSVNVTRVLVFCISAFLAAVAGALQGVSAQQVTGDPYNPFQSLVFFALVIISVGSEPWYALLAAFGLVIVPTFSLFASPNIQNWLSLLFGASALLYGANRLLAERMAGSVVQRLWKSRAPSPTRRRAPALVVVPARRPVVSGVLDIENLEVRFGGLIAVHGVSLHAPTGRITGLIGPNGAGKTTTFNVCSGLNRPTAGRVVLDGNDISRRGPAARARLGVGRTFQQMELFDSQTVWRNVSMGAEGGRAGLNALAHFVSTPRQNRQVEAATVEAIELCGLSEIADRTVATLSTGQRRLVELARCIAGDHRVLLLDEPSSGLDPNETERFGATLRRVVELRGTGILLVEHDMSLVTRICEYIYVLDFGRLIFEGATPDVLASPLVRAAYLGAEDEEMATIETDVDTGTAVAGAT